MCKERGKEEEMTVVATPQDKDGLIFTALSLLRRSLAKLGVLVVVL